MISVGDTAEDFTLSDQNGDPIAWSELRGRPAVFFFYPKASTPGCTKEACAFRDASGDFEAAGVRVFGVSADSVKRQSSFATKYELNMPLLSDPDHVLIEGWGIWGDKKMRGREYKGIIRTTVLFDADGVVRHVWSPVRVNGHVDAVLERVRQGI